MPSKSAYVVLQHKRHLFGVTTFPIMVFTDLVEANAKARKLQGSLPRTTFTVAITALK